MSCLVLSGLQLEYPPNHNLSGSLSAAHVSDSPSQSHWSERGSDLQPLRVYEQYYRASGGSPKGCSSGDVKGAAQSLQKPRAQLLLALFWPKVPKLHRVVPAW